MFCVNCGSKIGDHGKFCTACGKVLNAVPSSATPALPATPATPQTGSEGQILATPVSADRRVRKCSWCGEVIDASQSTCPKCGAALSAPASATQAGWSKLPGRKDMAKLHFGNSVCQIEGKYVPVADLKLAPEDSVYFTHHVLLWKDPQVNISVMPLKGVWRRMLGHLPLFMTEARGPGHVAFSQDNPGELIALPMEPGQMVDVREHLFLAATGNVAYDWIQNNIWFQTRNGNETETRYPIGQMMDRFMATDTPGLLLLQAAGNVFVRTLAPRQTILIRPTALVFRDPSVQMDVYYERPRMGLGVWRPASIGYLWLCLTGPGRVAIQSVFGPVEGEQNFSGPSQFCSLPTNVNGPWNL